jgi:hypothetical protein
MPFTGSHVAAVLPLCRKPFVTSALIIGSMAPDAPYYLHARPVGSAVTHTLPAVFGVNAVVGLCVFALWHAILAAPFLDALPNDVADAIRSRTRVGLRARLFPMRQLARVYLSLVVGASTHVVWDSFTHWGRWGPTNIDWLRDVHGPLHGYAIAQHVSSVAGAIALLIWVARWLRTAGIHVRRLRIPMASILLALILGVAAIAFGAAAGLDAMRSEAADPFGLAGFVFLTRGLFASAACSLLIALAWHVRRAWKAWPSSSR